MSESKQQRPKFNPPANVPVTIKLGYIPAKSNEGQYGEFWTYGISVDGIDHVWFTDSDLQQSLSAFSKGDSIVVCKREKVAEKSGRTYHVYEINQAEKDPIFTNTGKLAKPTPDLTKPKELEAYRTARKDDLFSAIEDVLEVQDLLTSKGYRADLFTPEQVQKYAVTFMIEKNGR